MSTYSPSLRIQLIPTGDQAGTWGNTTNTNLGTLIESAIAGYISVSVISASQALTALNGAADQSRNMSIALTTTTGAAFAVYAPPAEKTYVIYNASAYTATLYNSTVLGNTTAAGAGTAIPAGKTMTVWSDGTNFKFQNTHLVGTVVGNVAGDVTGNVTGNIDGNLTAAAPTAATAPNGTSTTQIATTAFVTTALQLIYPVGSIYTNASVATNPATLIGFGTWTAFGTGRVLVGINGADASFDTLGETGGSKDSVVVSHTHTANVTDPGHVHPYRSAANPNGAGSPSGTDTTPGESTSVYIDNTQSAVTGISVSNTATGVSGVNANLQPYIVVYMWQRTA